MNSTASPIGQLAPGSFPKPVRTHVNFAEATRCCKATLSPASRCEELPLGSQRQTHPFDPENRFLKVYGHRLPAHPTYPQLVVAGVFHGRAMRTALVSLMISAFLNLFTGTQAAKPSTPSTSASGALTHRDCPRAHFRQPRRYRADRPLRLELPRKSRFTEMRVIFHGDNGGKCGGGMISEIHFNPAPGKPPNRRHTEYSAHSAALVQTGIDMKRRACGFQKRARKRY